MPARPGWGERVVFCTRADCALRSVELAGVPDEEVGLQGLTWYRCEANCIIMDRRKRFGKPCASFSKKVAGAAPVKNDRRAG